MHSHDRTLLAKLAFADPDKAIPTHDFACQYLTTPTVAAAVIESAFPGINGYFRSFDRPIDEDQRDKRGPTPVITGRRRFNRAKMIRFESAAREQPISKGEGQYKTTIGFLDMIVVARCWEVDTGYRDMIRRHDLPRMAASHWLSDHRYYTEYGDSWFKDSHSYPCSIAVEVKIHPVPTGDLLRQINLYREYIKADRWVAVLDYDIAPSDLQDLRNEKVLHFRLSDRFGTWVAEQEQARAQVPLESVALI
jgi:hypothetical protein